MVITGQILPCDTPLCCAAARRRDSGGRQAKLLQHFMDLMAVSLGRPTAALYMDSAAPQARPAGDGGVSMTVGFDGMKNVCARVAVIGMVAFGSSACSSIPDWVDPTTWIGGSGPSNSEADAGETPDLASIPDRPAPASTADEQKQVASSLAADRAQAKYSAEALRGGTEAAAAPPPPVETSNDLVVPQTGPATAAAPPPQAPSTQIASNDQPAENAPSPTPDPSASADSDVPTETASSPPPSEAAQLPTANSTPAPAVAVASPPSSQSPTTMAMVSPSDAALGFRPSSAPPLDPSIGQFVPPPLIARYNQTANAAGMVESRIASVSPTSSRARGVGGPERMSGAVVANLETLQAAPSPASSATGANPASVVLFPGDGTLLNAEGRLQVRAAVEQFKRAGGGGYVRIVGHASSRTSNMPLEKHLEVIFNKSQDRANAVAKEVIKDGVPANRVLVEAVGDSQPVYYESMPQGEDGNRRAEIFLQS
jgi:outer membrane protein OmpA-like peptidoglycan-associated protein